MQEWLYIYRECLNRCSTRRSAEKRARITVIIILAQDMSVPILVLDVVCIHEVGVEVAAEVAVEVTRVIIVVKENTNLI